MKTRTIRIACAAVVCAVALCGGPVVAGTLVLEFDSTGGAILDGSGDATGFTDRLPGTGGNIPANDASLDLDTGLGVLNMNDTPGDLNGQAQMADTSAIGIKLSSLGFTGAQDFVVKARFVNIPDNVTISVPDQMVAFVGGSSTEMIRAGTINFDNFLDLGETRSNEGFGVNTNGNFDSAPRFFGADVGTEMDIEISRTGGVWSVLVDGIDRLPNTNADGSGTPQPPIFLDDNTDLYVGVLAQDVANDGTWSVQLDRFEATVVPEPASIALLGIAGAGALCGRRRWCR